MAIFQPGTKVEFKQPVISGEVVTAAIVDNDIQYLVVYTNDEGAEHQRWFRESELLVK